MQVELGSSYLYGPVNPEMGNDDKSIPFQYGTNAIDINKFLSSVLVGTNESSSEESFFCSALDCQTPTDVESEAEVYQPQVKWNSFACILQLQQDYFKSWMDILQNFLYCLSFDVQNTKSNLILW